MSADEEDIDPVRLGDDLDEPLDLREALGRERAFRVDYDEAKGLERFNAALTAADVSTKPTAPVTPSGGKWLRSTPGVVGLAVLIVGAGVGMTWLGRDDAAVEPLVTEAAPVMAPPETPEMPETPEIPTLSVKSLPTVPTSPPVARTARPPVTAQVNPPPAPSAPTVVDPLEETRHLGSLRRVAASDPEKALSMVADGNRRFAGGSFREERDAIAIDALARLGPDAEAKRAEATFLTTYPTSPLAPSVRRAAQL
ncbi:MAG: hypothetical protein J0I07_27075 [Myxococcales bacterium]|nr:hypothetical protein [Myxococcales bacterium]